MNDLIEIMWLGRGGQGGVTASRILALASFLEGKYATAFPLFGAERRGAPIKAFTRISNNQIYIHSLIYKADYVVILDQRLLKMVNVFENLKERGVLTINTNLSEKILKEKFGLGEVETWVVDATKICLDLNLQVAGFPVVNMPMTGAVAKSSKLVSLESVTKGIEEYFSEKLNPKALKLNIEAAERAYDETRKLS